MNTRKSMTGDALATLGNFPRKDVGNLELMEIPSLFFAPIATPIGISFSISVYWDMRGETPAARGFDI
jgi:hypothetical protein